MGMGMGMGMGGMGMMGGSSFPQPQMAALDKGKGREINWESQFDQYEGASKEEAGKSEEVTEEEELKAKVVDELEE